jgi:hypothetical protein
MISRKTTVFREVVEGTVPAVAPPGEDQAVSTILESFAIAHTFFIPSIILATDIIFLWLSYCNLKA